MPPMSFSSLAISRLEQQAFFLLRLSRPVSTTACMSFSFFKEPLTVLKLVEHAAQPALVHERHASALRFQ